MFVSSFTETPSKAQFTQGKQDDPSQPVSYQRIFFLHTHSPLNVLWQTSVGCQVPSVSSVPRRAAEKLVLHADSAYVKGVFLDLMVSLDTYWPGYTFCQGSQLALLRVLGNDFSHFPLTEVTAILGPDRSCTRGCMLVSWRTTCGEHQGLLITWLVSNLWWGVVKLKQLNVSSPWGKLALTGQA